MDDVVRELYAAAVHVARREDAEVHALTGDGVFSVPELAYAYLVGKEFAQRWAYGKGERIDWGREMSLGAGPTDLVLTGGFGTVAAEFKVRSTLPKYQADLIKLASAEHEGRPVDRRIFLALVDRFVGKADPRIDEIGGGEGAPTLDPVVPDFARFKTTTKHYAGEVECVVAAWRVG